MKSGPKPRPAAERFWVKVDKTAGLNGCWNWTAARHDAGYGKFWTGVRNDYAHRFSYELLVGPIPTGLQIDHLCRNRLCVNPAHLEAVPQRVNLMRGQGITAIKAAASECPNGHPYTAESTYITPQGHRTCRACRRVVDRRRRQKTAAA